MSEGASLILDYREPPPRRCTLAQVTSSPWVLLPLILLLAASLRWFQIERQSLWLDEFLALQNSTGRGQAHVHFQRNVLSDSPPGLTRLSDGPGLWSIWSSLATDSHPPLYFMVLNVWRNLFGEGDAAARALSAAFSLVALLLLFDVTRLLNGKTVAIWAVLLMAVAGVQIKYAQEARNYTMLLALTLATCDAVVRLEKLGPNRRRAAALTLSALAMMLTHYLALWPLVGIAFYAAIRLRSCAFKHALVSFASAAIIYAIIWGPFLLEQSSGLGRELSFGQEAPQGHLERTLHRACILPMRYFVEPMKRDYAIAHASGAMYLLPLLLLYWRRDLLLWCVLGAAAIVPIIISDVARSAQALAYARYSFVASAASYVLAAGMLSHMSGFLRWIVPLIMTVSCVAALNDPYAIRKADTREMAGYISSRCKSDDILLIHTGPGHDWQARTLYLGISHYAPPPCPILFIGETPSPQLARRIGQAESIWVMAPGNEIPLDEILPGAKVGEALLFPYVGMIERVRWTPTLTR